MKEFEEVAGEWQEYRQKPSTSLQLFEKYFSEIKGKNALDLGCGNGRNAIYLKEKGFEVLGIDSSKMMILFAKANAKKLNADVDFELKDARELNFNDRFQCVFSFAMFHHFNDGEQKIVLQNIFNALKKDGLLFLTVWNGKRISKQGSSLIDWKMKDGKVVKRFYYFFEEGELLDLLEESGFQIIESFYEKNGSKIEYPEKAMNLCFVVKKI